MNAWGVLYACWMILGVLLGFSAVIVTKFERGPFGRISCALLEAGLATTAVGIAGSGIYCAVVTW